MALEVEDGTGKSNAESYESVSNADTYHAARGRADWAGLAEAVKEQALRRATDYIDMRFGPRFRGDRLSAEQALQWPRLSAYDNSGLSYSGTRVIPPQLTRACSEYALVAARTLGELAANPPALNGTQLAAGGAVSGAGSPSGRIIRTRDSVGTSGIEKERYYASTTGPRGDLLDETTLPAYPLADGWLLELVRNSTSGDVVRA